MEIDKEVLESILDRFETGQAVRRVRSFLEENLRLVGDYNSEVTRVKMEVVLGNGRKTNRSLVLKRVPDLKAVREYVYEVGYFHEEIEMYGNIVKEIELLMEEFGDTRDVLFGRMVHFVPYSLIILEDLQRQGFGPAKVDYLDTEHTVLILMSLARYHGMIKVLEERRIVSRRPNNKYFFTSMSSVSRHLNYGGIQNLAKAVRHWGEEWRTVADKLRFSVEAYEEGVRKLEDIDEPSFNCLNHGDCWFGNMIFKYDYLDRPTQIRFLDLQNSIYGSPAIDVTYLLYTSVEPTLRRERFDFFLETWHAELTRTLKMYGFKGKGPSVKEIRAQIDRMSYAKLAFITMNILFINSSDKPFNINTSLTSPTPEEPYDESIFSESSLEYRWGPELKEIVKLLP